MNKKGFTLIELLTVIVIIGIIMTFAFPSITGMINNNKQKQYESYEKSMSEYTKAYFEDNDGIIGLEELKQVGLLGLDDDCIGYVVIDDNYKAYLKCGDEWETNGFNLNDAN